MKSLEKEHIETVEEAIQILHTSGYNHHSLKSRLNRLIGYLTATEELKNKESISDSSLTNQ